MAMENIFGSLTKEERIEKDKRLSKLREKYSDLETRYNLDIMKRNDLIQNLLLYIEEAKTVDDFLKEQFKSTYGKDFEAVMNLKGDKNDNN